MSLSIKETKKNCTFILFNDRSLGTLDKCHMPRLLIYMPMQGVCICRCKHMCLLFHVFVLLNILNLFIYLPFKQWRLWQPLWSPACLRDAPSVSTVGS
jgi:hypothetical protein